MIHRVIEEWRELQGFGDQVNVSLSLYIESLLDYVNMMKEWCSELQQMIKGEIKGETLTIEGGTTLYEVCK